MAFEKNVFPQSGDANDASRFAQLAGHDILVDYIERGIDVSADFANDSASVSEGVCYVSKDSDTATSDGAEIRNLGFAIQVESESFSLNTSGTQYVYVNPRLFTTDFPEVEVFTDESNAPSPGLKIAEVDNDNETVTYYNQNPSTTVETITITDSIDLQGSGAGVATLDADGELKTAQVPELAITEVHQVADDSERLSLTVQEGDIAYQSDEEATYIFSGGDPTSDADWEQINDRYTDEEVRDVTAQALSGGDKVTISHDDPGDTITIDTSALDPEEVEDQINSLLIGGSYISLTYDDTNDELTIDGTDTQLSDSEVVTVVNDEVTTAATSLSGLDSAVDSNDTDISNLQSDKLDSSSYTPESDTHDKYTDENAQDAVATALGGGDKVTVSYDDANDSITIDTAALDSEEVESRIDTVLSAGDKVSLTYDDANDDLQIDTSALDAEEVEDQVDTLLTGGTGISLTYDDTNGELTIDGTAQYGDEDAQDAVASALSGGDKVTVSYDDPGDTITIDTSALDPEEVDDRVDTLLSGGSNVTTSYDDANGTLTVDTSALDTEEVEDVVASLVTAGSNLSWSYDDANDTLTISLADSISVGTLEADSATIDGVKIPDEIDDTRNAVNQLFIQNARQDFELGLTILEMDDGQFEVYANDTRIADQSNVDLSLGSTLDGNGTVSLSSGVTEGFTEHDKEDYGFLPNSVWITDDIETNPANGTVVYEIEDENGNVVTVTQSETEGNVDVSGTIETYAVRTRAVLQRDTDTDESPVLDAYSAYISGQQPADYLEASVTGVAEA